MSREESTDRAHQIRARLEEYTAPLIGFPTVAAMYYIITNPFSSETKLTIVKTLLIPYLKLAGYPEEEIEAVEKLNLAYFELGAVPTNAPEVPDAVAYVLFFAIRPEPYALLVAAVGLGLLWYLEEYKDASD